MAINNNIFGEWKKNNHNIIVCFSETKDCFTAYTQDQAGREVKVESNNIKCGINGTISHSTYILKNEQIINSIAKKTIPDKFTAFRNLSEEKSIEVWIYESGPTVGNLIKAVKEHIQQKKFRKALKKIQIAFDMHKSNGEDTNELIAAILDIKKKIFEYEIQKSSVYLIPHEETKINDIMKIYAEEVDIVSSLLQHVKHSEAKARPHIHFIKALIHEYNENDLIKAVSFYLNLAEMHSNSLPCLLKAKSLVKKISDPFAFPHFLEKLDRNWLIENCYKIKNPVLETFVLQKDVVRMIFEKYLLKISKDFSQVKVPTCFICFNVKEDDVGKWLEHTLAPDLDIIGIKLIFCFRNLKMGYSLDSYQKLISTADQVIFVLTPEFKKKCIESDSAQTGVAQEVQYAEARFKDPNKSKTNFLLYLKGDRESSAPSSFYKDIFGLKLSILDSNIDDSLFSYYAKVFELFMLMRCADKEEGARKIARELKDDFLKEVNLILDGKTINIKQLDRWRKEKYKMG